MIWIFFFFVCIGKDFVWTLNSELTNLEENVVYNHLKNQTNLKLFYEKLIESNGVDHPKNVRQKITDQDIQKGNFDNKVNFFPHIFRKTFVIY